MKVVEVYERRVEFHFPFVKESTRIAYLSHWKNHVKPFFGDMEVESITTDVLEDFVERLVEGGRMNRSTAGDALMLVRQLVKYAGTRLNLRCFVLGEVRYPLGVRGKIERKERLTKGEVKKLIEYVKANPSPVNIGILVMVNSGIRIGEASGLRFEDFDLEKGVFTVNRIIQRIYDTSLKHTKILIGTPKTKSSHREIPLVPELRRMVSAYKKISRPDYYVLTCSPHPLEPRTFRNHIYAAQKKAGIDEPVHPHGLRHSFASMLVENGVDVVTVSGILGHSNTTTTLNMYCHASDDEKRKAISSMLRKLKI